MSTDASIDQIAPDAAPAAPTLETSRPCAEAAPAWHRLLACPVCRAEIVREHQQLRCTRRDCRARFPLLDGVPVLINEQNSVFDIADFLDRQATFFKPVGRFRRWVSRAMPELSCNVTARRTFAKLRDLLLKRDARPAVLVIGSGVVGAGVDVLLAHEGIDVVETDAAIGPRTQLICDAHDLPLKSGSFDAVVVQAVLEHVVDPHRCVEEIHRVLKRDGLIYADTPFIQQVHGREFDFTRFTRLGHRRLLRRFRELDSGITCGPGSALAWSARYFLLSFFRNPRLRAAASGLARATLFWLKYADYLLVARPGSLDAASAFYFLGRKQETSLSDRDLIAGYRGGF